jgi:hypothetical protein
MLGGFGVSIAILLVSGLAASFVGIILAVVFGFVVAGGLAPLLFFLFFKPTFKTTAARIDNLDLEERVLTMTECIEKGDNSFMANMQKTDTNKKLEAVNVKKMPYRFSRFPMILMALGLAVVLPMLVWSMQRIDRAGARTSATITWNYTMVDGFWNEQGVRVEAPDAFIDSYADVRVNMRLQPPWPIQRYNYLNNEWEWFRDPEFTQKWYFDIDVVKGDMTLYTNKQFDSGRGHVRHEIQFVTNGGTAVPSVFLFAGESITHSPQTTRAGYSFGGWYRGHNAATGEFFNSVTFDSPFIVTGNAQLHARWLREFRIVFVAPEADPIPAINANFDETFAAPRPAPTVEGLHFLGWFPSQATANLASIAPWNYLDQRWDFANNRLPEADIDALLQAGTLQTQNGILTFSLFAAWEDTATRLIRLMIQDLQNIVNGITRDNIAPLSAPEMRARLQTILDRVKAQTETVVELDPRIELIRVAREDIALAFPLQLVEQTLNPALRVVFERMFATLTSNLETIAEFNDYMLYYIEPEFNLGITRDGFPSCDDESCRGCPVCDPGTTAYRNAVLAAIRVAFDEDEIIELFNIDRADFDAGAAGDIAYRNALVRAYENTLRSAQWQAVRWARQDVNDARIAEIERVYEEMLRLFQEDPFENQLREIQDTIDRTPDQQLQQEMQDRMDQMMEDFENAETDEQRQQIIDEARQDIMDMMEEFLRQEMDNIQNEINEMEEGDERDEMQQRLDELRERLENADSLEEFADIMEELAELQEDMDGEGDDGDEPDFGLDPDDGEEENEFDPDDMIDIIGDTLYELLRLIGEEEYPEEPEPEPDPTIPTPGDGNNDRPWIFDGETSIEDVFDMCWEEVLEFLNNNPNLPDEMRQAILAYFNYLRPDAPSA